MTSIGDDGETTTLAKLCRAVPGALLPIVPEAEHMNPATAARAVHISELLDPTEYLDGGELLLTTGMALALNSSGCGAYVTRLADRDVAALALGLGPVHDEVPAVLIRACSRAGLPLLAVPAEVPFQRITRAFWSLVGGEQERELHEALRCQQRLVVAAATPEPVPRILQQLASALEGHAVLTDLRGHPRVASTTPWPYDPRELEGAVDRLRHAGPRTAATLSLGDRNAVIHPVLSHDDVVSYLAVVSPRPTAYRRNLVLTTLALLGMEATHRRTVGSGRQSARAAIAHLVDRGDLAAVPSLAEHLGVDPPPDRVRLVVARGTPAATLDTLVCALPTPSGRWWGTTTDRGAWVMLHPRRSEPDPRAVTAALADAASPARVVIGPVVSLGEVHGVRAALDAHAGALDPGTAQAWRSPDAVPLVTREWSEATLAPLRAAGDAILTTVASYLRHRGSWQRTATDLGLHRNSVRAHIARAERALGAPLSDPDLAARLWLALRETSVIGGHQEPAQTRSGR